MPTTTHTVHSTRGSQASSGELEEQKRATSPHDCARPPEVTRRQFKRLVSHATSKEASHARSRRLSLLAKVTLDEAKVRCVRGKRFSRSYCDLRATSSSLERVTRKPCSTSPGTLALLLSLNKLSNNADCTHSHRTHPSQLHTQSPRLTLTLNVQLPASRRFLTTPSGRPAPVTTDATTNLGRQNPGGYGGGGPIPQATPGGGPRGPTPPSPKKGGSAA